MIENFTAIKAIPVDLLTFDIPNTVIQNQITLNVQQRKTIDSSPFVEKHLSIIQLTEKTKTVRMGMVRDLSVSWKNDYFTDSMKRSLDRLSKPHHLVLYRREECQGDVYLLRADDCGYSLEYDTSGEEINILFSIQSINGIIKI